MLHRLAVYRAALANWLNAHQVRCLIICLCFFCATVLGPVLLRHSYLWLATFVLAIGFGYFCFHDEALPGPPVRNLNSADYWCAILLVLAFVPVFLFFQPSIPPQINEDEISTIRVINWELTDSVIDFLGVERRCAYFPTARFALDAVLSSAFTRVSLSSIRITDGLWGLAAVGMSFFFFRLFFLRSIAVAAAMILGSCHSLIGLSRMAIKNNQPLVLELLLLLLLVTALRRNSLRRFYLAGIVIGLGCYFYYSGRFFGLTAVVFLLTDCRRRSKWRALPEKLTALACAAMITASPIGVQTMLNWSEVKSYPQRQLAFQQDSVNESLGAVDNQQQPFSLERYWQGVWYGIAAFNRIAPSASGPYGNGLSAFLEPLTGILFLLGFLLIWVRKKRELERLALTGLLTTWVPVCFFFNKNPNYPRLLITLPFVVLLAGSALRFLSERWVVLNRNRRHVATSVIAGMVVISNLSAYSRYVVHGWERPDFPAAVVNLIRSDDSLRRAVFYCVEEEKSRFTVFLDCQTVLQELTTSSQRVEALNPNALYPPNLRAPALNERPVLIMHRRTFQAARPLLDFWYPDSRVEILGIKSQAVAVMPHYFAKK